MYENANMAGTTLKAERQPVAMEVVAFANELADRATRLAERVNGKLCPVMVSACPVPPTANGIESREYPPLFNDLRSRLFDIRNALCCIEDSMSRTEL